MNKEQLNSLLQDVDSLNKETLAEVKKLTEDYPWFQAGWLLYLKNLKNINAPEYESVLKRVAVMVPDRKVLFKFLNSSLPKRTVTIDKLKAASSVYQLEGDVKGEDTNSLIDRFLSSDNEGLKLGNNSGGVGNGISNNDVSSRSVTENDELITETLAAIYYRQKKYEKAQEAYHKLSLKYPEKSVYFASRIKEIEVLKKNN